MQVCMLTYARARTYASAQVVQCVQQLSAEVNDLKARLGRQEALLLKVLGAVRSFEALPQIGIETQSS